MKSLRVGSGLDFHFIRASLPVYLAVFHEDDAISNAKHAAQLVGDDNIGNAVILLEAFDELVDALRVIGSRPA